jgi:predicted DNA-binding transcriptional regulator YafY
MNRIDRLFGILTLLQSKKYVTAEKIAEKFHISIRTVYRDVKAISEQGIPVSFEPQKGYFIVQGYFLPPVSFSNEEANALLLMESIVSGFSDKSIQTYYSNALNKIKSVLRQSQKERIEALTNNIKLQVPSCFRYDFDYLSVIQNAIVSRSIIDMQYKNQHGESNRRKVEPVGLIFYALAWHLIAWCHYRKDYRDFKVARIVELRNTQLPFIKQQHLNLDEYLENLPENIKNALP